MGHHYVPQRYLRNFQIACRPGFLWMFDKVSGKGKEISIKTVAQESAFYDVEVEVELNEAVEKPAGPVIVSCLD